MRLSAPFTIVAQIFLFAETHGEGNCNPLQGSPIEWKIKTQNKHPKPQKQKLPSGWGVTILKPGPFSIHKVIAGLLSLILSFDFGIA